MLQYKIDTLVALQGSVIKVSEVNIRVRIFIFISVLALNLL